MALQVGIAVIFGAQPLKPIANVPPDALKVRVRLRNNDQAQAFVQFKDRIEHWILGPFDGTHKTCTQWELLRLQGVNAIPTGEVTVYGATIASEYFEAAKKKCGWAKMIGSLTERIKSHGLKDGGEQ
jgi:hypothetical protein